MCGIQEKAQKKEREEKGALKKAELCPHAYIIYFILPVFFFFLVILNVIKFSGKTLKLSPQWEKKSFHNTDGDGLGKNENKLSLRTLRGKGGAP